MKVAFLLSIASLLACSIQSLAYTVLRTSKQYQIRHESRFVAQKKVHHWSTTIRSTKVTTLNMVDLPYELLPVEPDPFGPGYTLSTFAVVAYFALVTKERLTEMEYEEIEHERDWFERKDRGEISDDEEYIPLAQLHFEQEKYITFDNMVPESITGIRNVFMSLVNRD
mmetsp:Transcript_26654/g.61316  ORF Transcript_26654/g.61316 Transcript_26654/m.61316 type:complete len:168 (-) Transcript_26654:621-1124(-)